MRLSLGLVFSFSFLLDYFSAYCFVLIFDLECLFTKWAMTRLAGYGHASLPVRNLFIKNISMRSQHLVLG